MCIELREDETSVFIKTSKVWCLWYFYTFENIAWCKAFRSKKYIKQQTKQVVDVDNVGILNIWQKLFYTKEFLLFIALFQLMVFTCILLCISWDLYILVIIRSEFFKSLLDWIFLPHFLLSNFTCTFSFNPFNKCMKLRLSPFYRWGKPREVSWPG